MAEKRKPKNRKKSGSSPEPNKTPTENKSISNISIWWLLLAGVVVIGLVLGGPEIVGLLGNGSPDVANAENGVEANGTDDNSTESVQSSDVGGGTDFKKIEFSEGLERQAIAQLKKIGKAYSGEADIATLEDKKIVSPDFRSRGIDFSRFKPIRENQVFSVRQFNQADEKSSPDSTKFSGVSGLRGAVEQLFQPFAKGFDKRSKFKVLHVTPHDDHFETVVMGGFFAKTSETGSLEGNSKLSIKWTLPENGRKPLIQSLDLMEMEMSEYAGDTPVAYLDCTASFLRNDSTLIDQFATGAEQWTTRVTHTEVNGHHGLAVGDANGDGRDDTYICQPTSMPNRLLIQQEDGTVEDVSAESGVDLMHFSRSALFVDLDNDGDQDLVVSVLFSLLVYSNDGTGKFRLESELLDARNAFSLSAADYDNDGDLDLYTCEYYPFNSHTTMLAFSYRLHDANNGGRNVLFRNDGGWSFTDVTREVGLEEANTRFSLAAAWEDYDNDGDMDLYVANDFGRNCFYVNENGKFRNRAAEMGIEDQSFGMSIDWADANRDGEMDLYVANMFSTAGHRITYQDSYLSERPEMRGLAQYMARGNSFFVGTGKDKFIDRGANANVAMGRWSWTSLFTDIDNDGWEDLVIANGFLTREKADDL